MAYIDGWPIVDGVRTLVGAGAVGGSGLPDNILTVSASDGADYTTIAAALAAASSGDVILVCPGTYAESNLAMVAGVHLWGTDADQCIISKSDAVNPIITSAVSVTISNLTVTNQSNAQPAISITANTLRIRSCIVNIVGAGNAIEMTNGVLYAYDSDISNGHIDLSTNACELHMYRCDLDDYINTSDALVHTLEIDTCYIPTGLVNSQATGATTASIRNSTIHQVTNNGTGSFIIYNCMIDDAETSNASGSIVLDGGALLECTDSTGSVVWWTAANSLRVLSGMKIAHAITAASAYDIIKLDAGYYNESNIGLKPYVSIIGDSRNDTVVYASDAANPIFVCSSGDVVELDNLYIQNTNAGAPAVKVNHSTGNLTLRNCYVTGTGVGDAIQMTAGTLNIHNSTIGAGDIDLSTAACALNMYNCQITTDPVDTSGNFAHTLKFYHCDFGGQNVASAATGATNLYFYACTNLGVVTEAGSGAIYVDGITDLSVVTVDGTTNAPTTNDYAKWTANGLEGKSYAEVKTDLSLNLVENTALSTWAGSANITAVGTLASGNVDAAVSAAGAATQGKVELATAAETTTGTDATRAVTPDGLAGSDYGKRVIIIKLVDDATALSTGDNAANAKFPIPQEMNGWNLVAAHAFVTTVSSSGTPTYMIHNLTDTNDMLSTAITIDANELTSYTAATAPAVNGATDDVVTGDMIRIDKDVAGTGEKGDGIILTFQLP